MSWQTVFMTRASRLLALVEALRRHRRPVTADTLAGELEVSLRTIYRDVAALMASRLPIRGEAGVGYVLDRGYDLPPMMFTPDEVEAIALGLRWLQANADAALARAAQNATAKIAAVMPKDRRAEIFDAALFAPRYSAGDETLGIDEAVLRQAIREERKIAMHYVDPSGGETERVVWPFGLAYFDRSRVVMAWCELREDFRHFRTDRMAQLRVLAQKYPKRRGVLLRRWQDEVLPRSPQISRVEK